VIVVTGLDDEGLALRAAREGVQDYVLKGSAGMRSLVRVIRFAIERHKTLGAAPLKDAGAPSGRILGFVGAKGGAGATTVALNVAAVLARQRKSVIALELDPFRAFSFQFRLTPRAAKRQRSGRQETASSLAASRELPCGLPLFAAQTGGFSRFQPLRPKPSSGLRRR
jgi:hypothetical protein